MVVEINGLELNYEVAGDGEPLLWLHGFMGAGPDGKDIFKEPPAGFRLIAPDPRGHGGSTNPSGEFSFRHKIYDAEGFRRHRTCQIQRRPSVLLQPEKTCFTWRRPRPTRIESMVIVSAPPNFRLRLGHSSDRSESMSVPLKRI